MILKNDFSFVMHSRFLITDAKEALIINLRFHLICVLTMELKNVVRDGIVRHFAAKRSEIALSDVSDGERLLGQQEICVCRAKHKTFIQDQVFNTVGSSFIR